MSFIEDAASRSEQNAEAFRQYVSAMSRWCQALGIALAFAARPVAAFSQSGYGAGGVDLVSYAARSIVYIVESRVGDRPRDCTGSIIQTNGRTSTVLTAAHCVEEFAVNPTLQLNIYQGINDDVRRKYRRILARGTFTGVDLALVEIDALREDQALKLGNQVQRGRAVGIVGFPEQSIFDFGGRGRLDPRQVDTNISVVIPRSVTGPQILELQRPIADGYSGGPLIDISCGCIVGVQSHNLNTNGVPIAGRAIGPQEILDFTRSANVPVVVVTPGPDFRITPDASVEVTYNYGNNAADPRVLLQIGPAMWAERYKTGNEELFRAINRANVDGNTGTVIEKLNQSAGPIWIFIPDIHATGNRPRVLRMSLSRPDSGWFAWETILTAR